MPRRAKFDPNQITSIYEQQVTKRVRDHVQRHINQESLKLITGINQDVKMMIQSVLRDGEEAGEPIAVVASKLLKTGLDKGIFRSARKRAWLIAKTELHRARQRAAMDIYRANDIPFVKWIGLADTPNICPFCLSKHGHVYNLTEAMEVLPPVHPRCYSADTEVYTKRGWLLFKDVFDSDLILTLEPNSKNLEWSNIKCRMQIPYIGKMKYLFNKKGSFDLLVTPNHPYFTYKRVDHGSLGRIETPLFLDNISELSAESRFYLSSKWLPTNNVNTVNINGVIIPINVFSEFMGYYLSEGSTCLRTWDKADNKYQISIAQCKKENREKIFECCKKLGVDKLWFGKQAITILDDRLALYLKEFGKSCEKCVPELIKESTSENIRIFLNAYLLGDGHTKISKVFDTQYISQSKIIDTVSKQMSDDLGELIIKSGKSVSYEIDYKKGSKHKFKNGEYILNHDVFRINELSSQYHFWNNIQVSDVDYAGIVYDLNLEKNHTLLVRRNGKVSWGSNCRCRLVPADLKLDFEVGQEAGHKVVHSKVKAGPKLVIMKKSDLEKARVNVKSYQRRGKLVVGYNREDPRNKKESNIRIDSLIIGAKRDNPELKALFESDAGVWEGYTIEEHTSLALRQFERYFAYGNYPFNSPLSYNVMQKVMLLHDVGKPIAIKRGDKRLQKQTNLYMMKTHIQHFYPGITPKQISIAEYLVSQDFVGEFLKEGGDAKKVAEHINNDAKSLSVSPVDLWLLMRMLWISDASAYTENAGGIKSLDNLFIFHKDKDTGEYDKVEVAPEVKKKFNDIFESLDKESDMKVFHGTLKENVESILNSGLLPQIKHNWTHDFYLGEREKKVFVARNIKLANIFGVEAVEHHFDAGIDDKKEIEREGVIIEAKIPMEFWINRGKQDDIAEGAAYMLPEVKPEWIQKVYRVKSDPERQSLYDSSNNPDDYPLIWDKGQWVQKSEGKYVTVYIPTSLHNLKKLLEQKKLEKSRKVPVKAHMREGHFVKQHMTTKKDAHPIFDNPRFQAWFKDSKVRDSEGNPLKMFHGTTHDFQVFKDSNGYSKNDFGVAHYFTSSTEDVNYNYATTKGADLTSRKEELAEELLQNGEFDELAWKYLGKYGITKNKDSDKNPIDELGHYNRDASTLVHNMALETAKKRLTENEGTVMPVFLAIKKPLDLDKEILDYNFDEDTEEESGKLVELKAAIEEVCSESYPDADPEKIWKHLNNPDMMPDKKELIDATFGDVITALRASYDEATDDYDGEGNFLRDVIKQMGYDGITYDAKERFPHMKNISFGTRHWIAFAGTQVKSATGNVGTYDTTNPDITKALGIMAEELAKEAAKVDTKPSEEQKEAGNYQKGHVTINGLDISIENPKGSYRSGLGADGKIWRSKLYSHYGYIKSTVGKDKEHLDVFIGDDLDSDRVFVVNQNNKEGKFDEHKIMLGFDSKEAAKEGYLENYEDDWTVGSIVEMGFDEFKDWAFNGDTTEIKKARPYTRHRKGKFEQVSGYTGKPRVHDLSPKERMEKFLNPAREDVKLVHQIANDIRTVGGRALIIGGAVRDALMGMESKDVDVEVYGVPVETLNQILQRHGKVDAVGANFGVLKVSTPELPESIDVSIPRRDNKVAAGHKGFIVEPDPTMTVEDAARRRDLTINSISYDPLTKEIIDPFNGLSDLKSRTLRVVDPTTFIEDPLRVLRVAQFAARLGFVPDAELIKISNEVNLTELPKERVYTELEKLFLKSRQPSFGLRLFEVLGINRQLFPEFSQLKFAKQDSTWHPEGDAWTHTLMVVDEAAKLRKRFLDPKDRMVFMLSALLHDIAKPETTSTREDGKIISHGHAEQGEEKAKRILERLTADSFVEPVGPLVHYHMAPISMFNTKVGAPAIRRLAKKVDIPMLVALGIADIKGRGVGAERTLRPYLWLWNRYKQLGLDQPDALVPKVLGRHLIQIGVKPGPDMGRMLNKIYEAQLEGRFTTPDEGVAYAQAQGWLNPEMEKSVPNCISTLRDKFNLIIDKDKSKKTLIQLKKSKVGWFNKRFEDGLRWVKSVNDGYLVQEKPKLGSKILTKGIISEIVAIGKDGVTTKDADGKRYQILHDDVPNYTYRDK